MTQTATVEFPYESPLEGYEMPKLSDELVHDGVHGTHLLNPERGLLSEAYERFPDPLDNGRRGGL
jgi:hypothetical protein